MNKVYSYNDDGNWICTCETCKQDSIDDESSESEFKFIPAQDRYEFSDCGQLKCGFCRKNLDYFGTIRDRYESETQEYYDTFADINKWLQQARR